MWSRWSASLFLLHLRSALVAILILPMAVLISFVVMYAQGISSNIMSLGGIAIAIGAMVDAVIIMIENAHKHMEHDRGKKQHWAIIRDASIEVGPTLFYSLLVITVSFIPVFTLRGAGGADVQAAGLHQDLLDGRGGAAIHHAGADPDGLLHPGQSCRRRKRTRSTAS